MAKTIRLRNLRKSHARCLCGLRVSLHFTPDNRKMSCEDASYEHPQATVRPVTFSDVLQKAVR